MNKNAVFAVGGLALLYFMFSNNTATAATNAPANINLNGLTNDTTDLGYLQSLYAELKTRGLSNQQILYMLSQCLYESGILTDVANYTLIQQNNFAGLTSISGGYASYQNISDFVDAYLGFLTKGSNPLAATSLTDFNSRLVQNHYYTENPAVYYNGLLSYYNELIASAQ